MDNSEIFKIKVIPKSKKTEIISVMSDGTIKIRLRAIPEKWKANEELCDFLHETYGGEWEILSGKTDSRKIVQKIKNTSD